MNILFNKILSKGDIVFDIGANIGHTSYVFSEMVGRDGCVCCFEPSRELFLDLQRNAEHFLSPAFLENIAINDGIKKTVRFFYSNQEPEAGTIINDPELVGEERLPSHIAYDVHTMSVDEYVGSTNRQPNLVKIDVEGAEYQVVRGMQRTIKQCAPLIFFESKSGVSDCDTSNHLEVLSMLDEAGYCFGIAELVVNDSAYRYALSAKDRTELPEFDFMWLHQNNSYFLANVLAFPASTQATHCVSRSYFACPWKPNDYKQLIRKIVPKRFLQQIVQSKRTIKNFINSEG